MAVIVGLMDKVLRAVSVLYPACSTAVNHTVQTNSAAVLSLVKSNTIVCTPLVSSLARIKLHDLNTHRD